MANRSQLHKTHLRDFSEWLKRRGWAESRKVVQYQAARFYRGDQWLVIYDRDRATQHYTVPRGVAEDELREWFGETGRGIRRRA